MNKGYISSPLNYIGGKFKLLPQLIPLFPKKINNFIDLFCGGANVGINISAEKIFFNDNLVYLIDLYKFFLNNDCVETIGFIEKRINDFSLSITNQQGYLKLREEYNNNRNPIDLFVLVAYSFNHQIRFNNKHQFNCPFGKERSSYNPNMRNNLIRFINALKKKNVEFTSLDFDHFDFSLLKSGDFVYADPPYLITTGTYNDGKRGFTGWSEMMEHKLLEILKELDIRNISFGLSNVLIHKGKINNTLLLWIEKNGYHVNYLQKNYSNCNYHTLDRNKNATTEVLVTNYMPENSDLTLF